MLKLAEVETAVSCWNGWISARRILNTEELGLERGYEYYVTKGGQYVTTDGSFARGIIYRSWERILDEYSVIR